MTGLTGQLRKGQFSSHWSTDWCTLNTHRSYRDPVIRVPVRPVPSTGTRCPVTPGILGTPGQTRCNRSHREHRSHRVHHPHRAILSWACYCRIDPLGLNQKARWTDLLLATGLTGQLRKGQFSSHLSTDQCTLNIYRLRRDPVMPVPVRRVPVPGARVHRVRPGATGQKAQKVQANQCLDQYELLVLNLPVRPVQLEHNVHESLGNMPSVQDEHSSEDSQACQSLLISDSLDDNADEYPDSLLCVILNIGLRASVTPITGQTMSI